MEVSEQATVVEGIRKNLRFLAVFADHEIGEEKVRLAKRTLWKLIESNDLLSDCQFFNLGRDLQWVFDYLARESGLDAFNLESKVLRDGFHRRNLLIKKERFSLDFDRESPIL